MRIRKLFRFIRNIGIVCAFIIPAATGAKWFISSPKARQPQAVITDDNPSTRYLHTFAPIDRLQRPGQVLYRKSYMVSYNRATKCPNWVLWELTRDHADGDIQRPDYAFHEDLAVPAPRAELTDYRSTGYDRGHICPAGDNKWDAEAMYETFLLTNICPQDKDLNSGLWNRIEMRCRYWAKKYGRLYIISGPLYLNGDHETIGHNKIIVPEAFFKVVVCLEGAPRGIAFICRNTAGSQQASYVYTIGETESITGYTFFPNLDAELAEAVKGRADIKDW